MPVSDGKDNICEGCGRGFLFRGWSRGLLHALPEEYLRQIFEYFFEYIFNYSKVGREGYYMHFLRHGVQGIDVHNLSDKVTTMLLGFSLKKELFFSFSLKSLTPTNKVMRDGAFVSQVPTVAGPVSVSLRVFVKYLEKDSV